MSLSGASDIGASETTVSVPARERRGRLGRLGRLGHAFVFGLTDGEAGVVAATGFIFRGGIVPLMLPAIVLPSVIDIAGRIGVSAISIAGQPTQWFVGVLVLATVAFGAWLVAANLTGAYLDVWLVRWALESSGGEAAQRLQPNPPLVLRLVAIRFICLAPVAMALAWAGARIYTSAYNELVAPANLATPLPVRVIEGAWDAVLLLAITWLATETLAAVAVRREIIGGRGIWPSLWEAVVEIVRRPVSTGLTFVALTAASLAAMAVALIGTAVTFDWCRIAARNTAPIAVQLGLWPFTTARDFRPVVFMLAVVALVAAWAVALGLSGMASAWRSAAWTNEVADSMQRHVELGLSGEGRDRSMS